MEKAQMMEDCAANSSLPETQQISLLEGQAPRAMHAWRELGG